MMNEPPSYDGGHHNDYGHHTDLGIVEHGHHPQHLGPGSVSSAPGPRPPSRTNITVKTDSAPGHVTQINLDIAYFKTMPGILKLLELIFGIVCMACASPARGFRNDSYGVGHNHFFLFVVVTSFICTLLWTFFYFLRMKDSMETRMPFSWLKLEYYYTAVVTVLYFIAFIVILAGYGYCSGSSWCDARIAAGVFGIFNTVTYGLATFLLHNDYKATPPELQ